MTTADREPPRPAGGTVGRPAFDAPQQPAPRPVPMSGTTTVSQSPIAVGPAAAVRKGPRRARLAVRRVDPWSTLKFAAVYSVALLVVLLVAVVVLYAIVDSMGVIDSIRTFLRDVDPPKPGHDVASYLSFGWVLGVSLVFGLVNVILITALATLSAFVYNICSDLVGGVEVTLTERE